jgi:hypothetical protein
MIDRMRRNGLRVLGAGLLAGCAQVRPQGRSLTTVSFNYTDRYLGDVVVDGAWTGGADAFGMGGGAQGLMAPSNPDRRVALKVQWNVGSIYNVESNTYTRAPIARRTVEVAVAWPYPANPSYLVLHFYSDGRVEAELEADRPKRRIAPPPGYQR